MDYRVISIGTLSQHPLWSGPQTARTPHATTTLVRSDKRVILVDPSLPAEILESRCRERAGIGFDAVTDVFLTSFRPAHRRALPGLTHARWWINATERETIGRALIGELEQVDANDAETEQMLKTDIALLQRCEEAPDALAEHVDLFPLPGYTPGTCGLLLALPGATVVIAGDAVVTVEHLERGQVLAGAYDLEQARRSLVEVIEIADWIVPGHDNLTPNLTRSAFGAFQT